MKTNYVLGFLFSEDKEKVLLIKKNRPDFQAGKLNGLGGKIENSVKINNHYSLDIPEIPLETMIREFKEECGIYYDNWEKFAEFGGENWHINVFKGFGDLSQAKTMTDEELVVVDIAYLPTNVKSDVRWLIPMALGNSFYIIDEL